MFIIAGLGNPTKEYEGTRHNVGFDVIDRLSEKYNIAVDTKKPPCADREGMIAGPEGHPRKTSDVYEPERGEHQEPP